MNIIGYVNRRRNIRRVVEVPFAVSFFDPVLKKLFPIQWRIHQMFQLPLNVAPAEELWYYVSSQIEENQDPIPDEGSSQKDVFEDVLGQAEDLEAAAIPPAPIQIEGSKKQSNLFIH